MEENTNQKKVERLLPLQVETKTEVEKKPKGFWRRLWDNVEPYYPTKRSYFKEGMRKLNNDISCGLVPSDQNFKEHKGLV